MLLDQEKVNLYRFLSTKLVDDDLYPHCSYGEKFSLEQVRNFWQRTVKSIASKQAPQKLGLYLHFPFCSHKCNYCFCDSYVPQSYKEVSAYINLIKREMDLFKDIFRSVSFTSVYFGGGSPSYLKPFDLDSIFKYIRGAFRLTPDCQIIFEGTPTDLNKANLDLIAKHGVKRLTIGVQSLNPKVVKLIRRPQTKEKFIRVFKYARQAGIPYINVDLIVGLQGQTVQSFVNDLKLVIKLGADVIHVNGFAPLAHTPFIREGNQISVYQRKNREKMFALAHEIMHEYAKDVWGEEGAALSEAAVNAQERDVRRENSSLLGIGYSAQSHALGQVWYEHPHLILMDKRPSFKKLPVFFGVRGSLDEEMRKFMFNNIQRGFSRKFFSDLFKKDALEAFKDEFEELISMNMIKLDGDNVVSCIGPRKEFLALSKLFYSGKRIEAILRVHKKDYCKIRDYKKELDILYADAK